MLQLFIPYNFASIREIGCGFSRITLATYMLPVVLILVIIEKIVKITGLKVNIVDGCIRKFFPNLWKDKA